MSGRVARMSARARAAAQRGLDWVEDSRGNQPTVDLAVRLYERDRDTFASVLGAAIALRLFLFLVPTVVMVVGLILTVAGKGTLTSYAESAGITGSVLRQIESAVVDTRQAAFLVFLSGLFLSLWAGRNLTKVLAACSAGAWQLGGRHGRATVRMSGAITGMLLLVVVSTAVINRLRAEFGVAAAASSLLVTASVFAVGWFLVCWTLPSTTRDASAFVPGGVVFGVSLACLQWVMQFYLPGRIERASETMGTLAVSIAALGYLFLIGRLMAVTLILDAVVFERFGSLSHFLFGLPVLRRIPPKMPRVARFFGFDEAQAPRDQPSDDPPS